MRTQDRGVVSNFKSYNHRLYQPGETFEAKDEDVEGFVQADYVEPVQQKARKSSKK